MTQEEADGAARGGGAPWQTVALVAMAVLGAATLVALILTLSNANRQRDRALELQAHSYDVMILARTLSATIARSEASLGRYLISTDRGLGQLYFEQWRLAGMQIDRLDQLTNDNAEQSGRIDDLRAAYAARGGELSLIALSTRYGKNGQALSRFYKARQAPSLAAIDRTLNRIIVRERTLLDARTGEAMQAVDRSSHIAGALAAFGILLALGAVFMGWLTINAVGERATARAEADAARERADELAEAVAAATDELRIQEAKLRQAQKMDAVGKLTGGIAHDFNNMLAVVLGGLELARRWIHTDPAAAARHIDNATDGASRAAALTRRLLAFSREDSLRPEPIVAATLVSGMTDLLDRTLGDAITVETQDSAGSWCVLADRVQLENAILNLAVNARDAMDGRGRLSIVTRRAVLAENEVGSNAAGEHVAIEVRDEGCGMLPEVIERAFEPFFTTKAVGKGTGLGLSQIFALVRQLGGEITIDTAVNVGTTVTLFLPRDTEAGCDTGAVVEIAAPANQLPPTLTILVVEDDPRVLAATMGALYELGHRPIACEDPLRAEELLDAHPEVDLVITDVLMPGRTGPEVIAAIGPAFPHVAVLFVTGFAGEANAAEFGGHQVLRKPFTLAALERAIDAAMARDRPAPPHQIAAE